MRPIRIITPTGHLGTTPLEKASFERGCAASPVHPHCASLSCLGRGRLRGRRSRHRDVPRDLLLGVALAGPGHRPHHLVRRGSRPGAVGEATAAMKLLLAGAALVACGLVMHLTEPVSTLDCRRAAGAPPACTVTRGLFGAVAFARQDVPAAAAPLAANAPVAG